MRTTLLLALAAPAVVCAQTVHDPNYTLSLEIGGLSNPMGVAVDASDNVYIADSRNGRVLKRTVGVYSPLITGLPTDGAFGGIEFGPLAVMISGNRLLVGEGGQATGTDRILHYDLNGALVNTLPTHPGGGNWFGIAVAGNGDIFANSSNTDLIFRSSPSGGSWGALSVFANTFDDDMVSPTGLLTMGNVLFTSVFNGINQEGVIATYDITTGALLNSSFASGFIGPTGLTILSPTEMLAAEFGEFSGGLGKLWKVNATSGSKTLLVDNFQYSTGVAVGTDGSIYFTDMGTPNGSDGRLLRLTPVPEPSTIVTVGIALVLVMRRRSSNQ